MTREEYNKLQLGDWVVAQGSGLLRQVTGICRPYATLRIGKGGRYRRYTQFFPVNKDYVFDLLRSKIADRLNYKITKFEFNEETKSVKIYMENYGDWAGYRK